MTQIQRFRHTTYVRDVPMLPIFRWHDKMVVPQGNVGIFLYPTESGEELGDWRSVEVIDEHSGLLSTFFEQVVVCDDSLFILSRIGPDSSREHRRQLLMRWDRNTKSTALLFDSHQEGSVISITEQTEISIQHMGIDRENRKILLMVQAPGIRNTWEYDIATGNWRRQSEPWVLATIKEARDGKEPAVWPEDEPMPYGFVNWNDGTLGITGFGGDWKIEYFIQSPSATEIAVTGPLERKQPDLLDQVVNGFDPQPDKLASLDAFLNSLIQRKRDGQPVTELELRQSVERYNRYCNDIMIKHNASGSIGVALQRIPPPDNTDVYLNSVRMALVHYTRYGGWMDPGRTTSGPNALPDMIRRLQSEFDPVLLFATIFPSVHRGDVGHAVRAVETLLEVDPYLGRKAMIVSTDVRPHDAWMPEYYLERGRDKEALRAAAMLGDTQTQIGLQTQAAFLDKYGDLAEAERLFIRAEEEFGFHGTNSISDRTSLADFYSRRRDQTDASGVPYSRKLDELRDRYFPDGMRRVTLADFRESPRAGARFTMRTIFARDHGINQGDVIVAVNGIQVDTVAQYFFVRDLDASNPRMELILWNGDEYVDVVTDLKDRRFRLRFDNYEP